MSKTPEEVDAIMESINPPLFRYRWCGGEAGPCACMGCVQICSRTRMLEKVIGYRPRIDSEHIDLSAIPADIREACTITREEWEAWKVRNPEPPDVAEKSGYTVHYGISFHPPGMSHKKDPEP